MTTYAAINALRNDALERGLHELAVIYGWSLIRMNFEGLACKQAEGRR